MKKLLKEYGLNSDMQYMELIGKSFVDGQRQKGIDMFVAMPKKDRKNMIHSMFFHNYSFGISKQDQETLFKLI